ncbi:MAG: tRNA (N6-isopentenyl adenosine(37)-C2)-methylthiotransferase MiaB [Patescibacteria group bacterium]
MSVSKNYHIITFGCQANISDSERIANILEELGYRPSPVLERVDVLVINTCSVRQVAEDKVLGRAPKLQILKNKNANLKIILTGCMLHHNLSRLKNILPPVDIFLPIKDLWRLPGLLGGNLKINPQEYLSFSSKYQSNFSAFVPISYGCNNFCTYCIVPFSRGREYSRPKAEIIREIKKLVSKNYKEIWLLGQNVNSYGLEEKTIWNNKTRKNFIPKIQRGRCSFEELLEEIDKIKGDFWLRFTSPHPKDFSEKTINTLSHLKRFVHYINLPVQSGDDEILKKMNRPYTVAHYKELIKKLRKSIPDIAISTDVIVGFPGENKKQFLNTAKLFREVKYDMAFISKYSPRPQTAAAISFKDNIFWEEKDRRFEVLNEILKKTAKLRNKKFENEKTKVLFSEYKNGFLLGKNEQYKTVKVLMDKKDAQKFIGNFAEVKIKKGREWGLEGEIIHG